MRSLIVRSSAFIFSEIVGAFKPGTYDFDWLGNCDNTSYTATSIVEGNTWKFAVTKSVTRIFCDNPQFTGKCNVYKVVISEPNSEKLLASSVKKRRSTRNRCSLA